MFCHKCGTKLADDAAFCIKCGAKMIIDNNVEQVSLQESLQPMQAQTPNVSMNMPEVSLQESTQPIQAQYGVPITLPQKKKRNKLLIILGVIALLIALVLFVVFNWEGKLDYEATVRAYTPFAISQGLPYTCGEVFDKYIPGAKWKIRKSGDTAAYVDISGTAKGTERKLVVTIKVTEDPSDPDIVNFTPEVVSIDGKKAPAHSDVADFLFTMFLMYDEKSDDIAGLFSEDGTPSTSKTIANKTQSYDNDFGNMEVTLDYVEFVDKLTDTQTGDDIYPEDDCVFLRAAVTVKNIGTKDAGLPTGWKKIIYDGKYEFVEYFLYTGDDLANIKPLSHPKSGTLIFTVSNSAAESDKSLVLNINNVDGKPVISYVLRPDGGTIDSDRSGAQDNSKPAGGSTKVSANDFVGTYSYDASFETPNGQYNNFYYLLKIGEYEGDLVVTETWRGIFMFDNIRVSSDNLTDNKLVFTSTPEPGAAAENHSLTYIPAKESPWLMDTIFIDGDETMPFLRE